MSRRIFLDQDPIRSPDLFTKVLLKNVQPGDIFQGRKNKTKWYANTDGQKAVDVGRTYWRLKKAGKKGPSVVLKKGPVLPKKKQPKASPARKPTKPPKAVPVKQRPTAKAKPVKKVPPPVVAGSISKDSKGDLTVVIKAPTIAKLRGAKKRVGLLEGK